MLLALVCVLWFVRRMLAVWRASAGDSPNESTQRRDERGPFAVGQLGIDRILARAATIVVIFGCAFAR